MKKHLKQLETTRNSLINSFWQLYKANDISKISITKICNIANYDRSTFYRYFFDISDILIQVEDNLINNLREGINKSTLDTTQKLTNNGFKRFNEKYGEYIAVFYEKGNRRFYLKFKNLVKNHVFNYFDLKIQDEEKREFLFEFMFSSLIASYVYWYRNQEMMELESFTKLVNNMVMYGGQLILNNLK